MMPALKGKSKSQFNMEQMFQSLIKRMLQSNVGLMSDPDVTPTLLSYVETTLLSNVKPIYILNF